LIWQRLSPIWQACVIQAWEAYCHNSLPHGAVIVDESGNIVAHGRNRIRELEGEGRQFARNRLAHAEINALLDLDWKTVNVYGCALYSTVEPCLMCTGAVRMAHMKEIHYACNDSGAGGTTLIDKTPFFKDGDIHLHGPHDEELLVILMALQVEATLSQHHPNPDAWINQLARDVPRGKTLGYKLFEDGLVVRAHEEGRDAAYVIDLIHDQLTVLA